MKGNKKTLIVVLLILFLIVGGAGGYLLWRVNQEKTVAPTDSDAGEEQCLPVCTCFSYASDENGSLFRGVSSRNKEPEPIKQPFDIVLGDSCASGQPILAVPNDPTIWEFDHWEVQSNTDNPVCTCDSKSDSGDTSDKKRIPTSPTGKAGVTSPSANPRTDKAKNTQPDGTSYLGGSWSIKAVFKKKTPSDDEDCMDVLTCFSYTTDEHGKLEYANKVGEEIPQPLKITLKNSCEIGQSIKAVPSSPEWEFERWEVTQGSPCSDGGDSRVPEISGGELTGPTANPRTDKASNQCLDGISCLGKSWDVKALFKQKQSPLLYTVTYSYTPGEGGHLRRDKVDLDPHVFIHLRDIVPGTKGPLVEAVPNENYKFDGWFESDGKGGILNPDKPISTSPSRQDIINSSFTVVARFSPKLKEEDQNLFTVTYSYTPAEGGRLKKDGEFIPANTSIVLKNVPANTKGPLVLAVPNANFNFDGWFESDGKGGVAGLVSDNPERQDTITSSFTLVAKFSAKATPPGGGETPPGGGGTTPDIELPDGKDNSSLTKQTLTVGKSASITDEDLPDTAMATTSKITILVGSIFLFVGLGLGWPKVVETFLTKENVPYVIHPEVSSKVKSKKK